MQKENSTLLVIEDPGLSQLFQKLRIGTRLKARIVLSLGNGRYLMRIRGYNLVMASKIPFQRFEELLVEVRRLRPRLNVTVIKRSTPVEKHSGRKTDIVV